MNIVTCLKTLLLASEVTKNAYASENLDMLFRIRLHVLMNITVTDRMFTKLFGLNFLQGLIFLIIFFWPKFSLTQTFLDLKKVLDQKFFCHKIL